MFRRLIAAMFIIAPLWGCYTSRDASTLVVQNGGRAPAGSNYCPAVAQTVTASPHQSATTATHFVLYTLCGVALVGLVAAVVWLIHNRGKLLGIATTAAKLAVP